MVLAESHSSLYFESLKFVFWWPQNHPSCCFGCQSVRTLELCKLGGHGRIATGELFDGDILCLVVGDAQVAICPFECLLGLFQVIDGLVNLINRGLKAAGSKVKVLCEARFE
jgi:hypothetical protein